MRVLLLTTIYCQYVPRSLAVLIHVAMAALLSFFLVKGVVQSVLGSAAPAALVPPQLCPRRRRRLVEVRYYWSCPRSVVPVWRSDVWLIRFGSWIPS